MPIVFLPNTNSHAPRGRIPKSRASATRRPPVPPLFAHFPGAAAAAAAAVSSSVADERERGTRDARRIEER